MSRTGSSVIIVGGGVIGLAVAWQLGRLGVSDVRVLERWSAAGTESSSRANGGVRQQFTTPINVAFSKYAVGEFERMESERGTLGFRQAGYLMIAGSSETAALLRRACTIQQDLGVDTIWLSPDDVVSRASYVRADGIVGGTFCASDGFIDPHGVISTYLTEARTHGVRVDLGVEVQTIEKGPRQGFRVETNRGPFECDMLVNAAGSDAASVAGMVGVDLPVTPVRRNLACTEPVIGYPDLIPMTVDVDMRLAVRREVSGGFVISYSSPDDPPTRQTSFDPGFLTEIGLRIDNRFPFLGSVPIDHRKCWAGLYPETPDSHAIVGTVDAVPGLVLATGFAGHGVMHSPAAGLAVAELIVDGRSDTFDLRSLRLERFDEGDELVEISSW